MKSQCKNVQMLLIESKGKLPEGEVAKHIASCTDCKTIAESLTPFHTMYRGDPPGIENAVNLAQETFAMDLPKSTTPWVWPWLSLGLSTACLILWFGFSSTTTQSNNLKSNTSTNKTVQIQESTVAFEQQAVAVLYGVPIYKRGSTAVRQRISPYLKILNSIDTLEK